MNTRSFIIGWALIVLLVGACTVQAGTIRSYDFEGLTDGSLLGQDTPAWVKAHPSWGDFAVGDVVGADGNTSKAIHRSSAVFTGNYVGNVRDWPVSEQVSFTSTDTAVWQSYQFKPNPNTSTSEKIICGGVQFENETNNYYMVFGMERYPYGPSSGGTNCWYLRDSNGSISWGDATVTDNSWHEVKLIMDFSTPGGLGTLYHRDLTGGTGWVQDSVIVNKPLNIAPTAGEYVVTGLKFYTNDAWGSDDPPAGWIDNYVFDDPKIPEPGTLVLLATGLIGLLCYAWRKRK